MIARQKQPDRKRAQSLLEAASRECKFALSLKPSDETGSTIVRNTYESFRMLGESILASKGIVSEDHIVPIGELLKLKVDTKRPVNLLDNLRRLTHNVNYNGYKPTIAEIEDAISLSKACFEPILKEVEKIIKIS